MSKQCILKDIERLKKANDFLKPLFANIKNYKSAGGTSYPVGVPNFNYRDEFQIDYNEMCIEIMEYFVESSATRKNFNLGNTSLAG